MADYRPSTRRPNNSDHNLVANQPQLNSETIVACFFDTHRAAVPCSHKLIPWLHGTAGRRVSENKRLWSMVWFERARSYPGRGCVRVYNMYVIYVYDLVQGIFVRFINNSTPCPVPIQSFYWWQTIIPHIYNAKLRASACYRIESNGVNDGETKQHDKQGSRQVNHGIFVS